MTKVQKKKLREILGGYKVVTSKKPFVTKQGIKYQKVVKKWQSV